MLRMFVICCLTKFIRSKRMDKISDTKIVFYTKLLEWRSMFGEYYSKRAQDEFDKTVGG